MNESNIVKKEVKAVSIKFLCDNSLNDLFDKNMVKKERFVETSSNATVEHMIQYLKTRIEIDLGVLKMKHVIENDSTKNDRVQNIKLFTVKGTDQTVLEINKSLADLIESESEISQLEIYFSCDLKK